MMDAGEILAYLDRSITHWRRIARDPFYAQRAFPDAAPDVTEELMRIAPYYIDAFQSVRTTLCGTLLPAEEQETP